MPNLADEYIYKVTYDFNSATPEDPEWLPGNAILDEKAEFQAFLHALNTDDNVRNIHVYRTKYAGWGEVVVP